MVLDFEMLMLTFVGKTPVYPLSVAVVLIPSTTSRCTRCLKKLLKTLNADFYQGARPDGDLAVPPELEAYFSVDAQVQAG